MRYGTAMCWLQDRGLLEVSKYSSKSSKMNGLLKAYHSKKLQPRTSRSLENLRRASSCDSLIISKGSKSIKLQKLRFTKLQKLLCGGLKLFRVSSFLEFQAFRAAVVLPYMNTKMAEKAG